MIKNPIYKKSNCVFRDPDQKANNSGTVQTKRHPISKRPADAKIEKPKKTKCKKENGESKAKDGIKKEGEESSSEDSDATEDYDGTTEEEDGPEIKSEQMSPNAKSSDSDESLAKRKIDVYLKDVDKKEEKDVKKSSPASFQAAFENLLATRSAAMALRPGSVVEEAPPKPRPPRPRKRKVEVVKVEPPCAIDEEGGTTSTVGTQVKEELDLKFETLPVLTQEQIVATEMKMDEQLIPKKKPRKEHQQPKNPYSFIPLSETKAKAKSPEFNRLNFLMPTIQWIKQQQLLQGKGESSKVVPSTSTSPFGSSSGLTFGDLIVPTQTTTATTLTLNPPKGVLPLDASSMVVASTQTSASVPKKVTVITPSAHKTAEYVKTIKVQNVEKTSNNALDLSIPVTLKPQTSPQVPAVTGLQATNLASSQTLMSDSADVAPICSPKKKTELETHLQKPDMKLTGQQKNLLSSMNQIFELTNSMVNQKRDAISSSSVSTKSSADVIQSPGSSTGSRSPRSAHHSPGSAGRSPGSASRSPGSTNRSPGSTSRSPGSLNRSPRSLLIPAHQVMQRDPSASVLHDHGGLRSPTSTSNLNLLSAAAVGSVSHGTPTTKQSAVNSLTFAKMVNHKANLQQRQHLSSSSPLSPRTPAHQAQPETPMRFQYLNAASSAAQQQQHLLQAGVNPSQLSSQQQTFLVNIPVMHSGTTTGVSSSATATSINASQGKQKHIIVNSSSGVIDVVRLGQPQPTMTPTAQSKQTVGQLLKASRAKQGVKVNGIAHSQVTPLIQIRPTGNSGIVQTPNVAQTVNVINTVSVPPTGTPAVILPTASSSLGSVGVLGQVSHAGSAKTLLSSSGSQVPILPITSQVAKSGKSQSLANILIQQPIQSRLAAQLTSPLNISVTVAPQQVTKNAGLCIVSQSKPAPSLLTSPTNTIASVNSVSETSSTSLVSSTSSKPKVVPEFGGSPQFGGTTQFLLQGVTQIHPTPSSFKVDAKTPLFQNLASTNPSSTVIDKSKGVKPAVIAVSANSAINGVETDQSYGAIVSPNKVLQLVPQSVVPPSQVSSTSVVQSLSSPTNHEYAMSPSKAQSVSSSGAPKSPVYSMTSPVSEGDKTVVQASFNGTGKGAKKGKHKSGDSSIDEAAQVKVVLS